MPLNSNRKSATKEFMQGPFRGLLAPIRSFVSAGDSSYLVDDLLLVLEGECPSAAIDPEDNQVVVVELDIEWRSASPFSVAGPKL
jgi:hypothetical protein